MRELSRGVAQSGSAQRLGRWGRGFKSLRPDHFPSIPIEPIADAVGSLLYPGLPSSLCVAVVGGAMLYVSIWLVCGQSAIVDPRLYRQLDLRGIAAHSGTVRV